MLSLLRQERKLPAQLTLLKAPAIEGLWDSPAFQHGQRGLLVGLDSDVTRTFTPKRHIAREFSVGHVLQEGGAPRQSVTLDSPVPWDTQNTVSQRMGSHRARPLVDPPTNPVPPD